MYVFISAHSGGNKKATWTEQEEEELGRLFMENQANPETDEGKWYSVFTSLYFFLGFSLLNIFINVLVNLFCVVIDFVQNFYNKFKSLI